MATKNSGRGNATKMGVAAAVTAAAVATAAGAYWLYGAKDAVRNRKTVKSWMLKARAEVMDALEKAGEIDKDTYLKIVNNVVKGYSSIAGAQSKEIKQLVSELKDSWGHIQAAQRSGAKGVKTAKRTAKRVVKKISRK